MSSNPNPLEFAPESGFHHRSHQRHHTLRPDLGYSLHLPLSRHPMVLQSIRRVCNSLWSCTCLNVLTVFLDLLLSQSLARTISPQFHPRCFRNIRRNCSVHPSRGVQDAVDSRRVEVGPGFERDDVTWGHAGREMPLHPPSDPLLDFVPHQPPRTPNRAIAQQSQCLHPARSTLPSSVSLRFSQLKL